jgi:hypothetical protein
MMYKTPTFAEPQQCNIPFSWGHVSAFIKINTETGMLLLRSEWKVQGRTQVKYLIGQFLNLKIAANLHSNYTFILRN